MTAYLTDAQVARLFELCEKIVAVIQEIPAPPPGIDAALERARGLRNNLEKQNAVLVELGALLR